jgi:hypothetical protein
MRVKEREAVYWDPIGQEREREDKGWYTGL